LVLPGRTGFAQRTINDGFKSSSKYEVSDTHEKIELVTGTSRRLRFSFDIPDFVLGDPEVVQAQPVSPNEIVIRGGKPGITSITVSDPNRKLTTIDINVIGDVRKLQAVLDRAFPDANIVPVPLNKGVMLSGNVVRASDIATVVNVTKDYFPANVLNNLQVGGSQLIAMEVKVYEVSRSKVRDVGVDWAYADDSFKFISSIADLISTASAGAGVLAAGGGNISFGAISNDSTFSAFIQFLEKRNVARLLDKPTLVAMNGRAAEFLSGGEVPIQVASGLGTNSIEFRPFGTKLDVVPIILGQGRVRLEIRAEVSEIAPDLSGDSSIPGFRVRRVNTGVEMNVGHTLALAGDYREEFESQRQQIPFVGNLPTIGQIFRRKNDSNNEVELVFMITPRFVGEVEANQVPPRGPGQMASQPSDIEFYGKGYDEVPYCGDDCPINYVAPPQAHGLRQPQANAQPRDWSTPGGSTFPGTTAPASTSQPTFETPRVEPKKTGLKLPSFLRKSTRTADQRSSFGYPNR
ncbi:pilus assembly protein N-terminal domain-containing protein, partial [Vicingaceae bacterium]|nr:pilus assembly protein N-terminal domain-containing protein [Vicingaceae bacterium]